MRLCFRTRPVSAIAGLNFGPVGLEHFFISSQPSVQSLSRRFRSFPLSAYWGNKVALPFRSGAIYTRGTPIASDLALSAANTGEALEVAAGFLWQLHHHRLFPP